MPEKRRSGDRGTCESLQKLYIVRKVLCKLQSIVTVLVTGYKLQDSLVRLLLQTLTYTY